MIIARRYHRLPLILSAALLMVPLAGCDWFSGSSSSTKMQNVEIQPGTASDEMITLDQASGDATAIDPSTAIGPPTAGNSHSNGARSDGDDDAASDGAPVDGAATSTEPAAGDQVIAPPAGGAEPTRPAATAGSAASGTR